MGLPWRWTPYYGHPHEYVVADWSLGIGQIISEVQGAIKERGYAKKFYRATFRYVDIGDYTYWVMFPVLNRIKRGENA